ncbi:LIC_13387 family protein [Occallatibacter savannae]|uniref:LIC_13387 family protein n=1 Tax=Occallatibacter savannae TaxID=1002691 RepID=UPI000D69232A|nr:hypothetical protein [Occallatibacter savannae]
MKPVLFLRIASVLVLIHAVLHTVGGVFGKPAPGVASAVAAHMRTQFPVFGVTRSYADFYLGLGLGITIFLTADALLLWILASMAKTDASRLRPLIAVFALAYLAFAVNSYMFFFPAPVVAEVLIVASLIAAIVTAKPVDARESHANSAPLKTVQP